MGFQNFYSSKISNDIGAADASIIVDSPPTSTSGRMTLEARNTTQREIIKYTGVAGNTLTGVLRGQGGTTAKSHVKGALIQQNATAEDLQDLYNAFNSFAAVNNDWRTLPTLPTTITNNGNRSYNLTIPGVDYTSILSKGMRGKAVRTVTAPTQCTSLNGTTQYYSKTSPAGMTFTDDFTVSAWIKLTSYSLAGIMSRITATSGWVLYMNGSGQVNIAGRTGSADRTGTSYQSVPLNKWVHIATTLDMSANTSTIYFDGVSVPLTMTGASTSLTQAGNLEVGSITAASFFPGKIAQAAVFSSVLSAATIRSYMNQTLSGTETSLISAYSFNNSINDLNTTNANNLTANGSAVATNVDSPFAQGSDTVETAGTTEYFIITSKPTFSTDTTFTVQVPEGCALPTSGGISALSYSTQKAPYGMPVSKNKWRLTSLLRTAYPTTSNATYGAFIGAGWALVIPVGGWSVGWQASLFTNVTTELYFNISSTALTGKTNTAGYDASPFAARLVTPSAANMEIQVYVQQSQDISAQSTYVMYTLGATNAGQVTGNVGITEIFAECDYV